MSEVKLKQKMIRELLERHSIDAVLLRRAGSFAWATCGAASYVNTAATNGAASLLITLRSRYVITDNIEATRLRQEENLESQGWEFHIAPWYEMNDAVVELARGLRLGADHACPGAVDLSTELSRLRATLTPEEGVRFRSLSRGCADAMDKAIRAVHPGMTEHQIAGLLAGEVQSLGIQPTVVLIATDERIFQFRHPLPTDRRMERYAMLVLCGREWGLICSITRLVYFGQLPDDLRRKAEAVAYVDARLIASTHSGRRLRDIFQEAVNAYREQGFPAEWKLHHQGGPAGYEPREFFATPNADDEVSVGQVYAWNPSITGVKSEDTILVGEKENEILTEIPGWPTVKINIDNQVMERPAILEVK